VVFVGLAMFVPGAAMAQVRSTLDAQVPDDHEYVVAVWFTKSDKASFQSRIMDPSIPGSYDRQAWEDGKEKWNAPDSKGEMRVFTVRTTRNSRQTERQQVMARIEQEKKRIDWIEKPKPMDDVTLRAKITGTWSRIVDYSGPLDNARDQKGRKYVEVYNIDGKLTYKSASPFGTLIDDRSTKWKVENGKLYVVNPEGKWVNGALPWNWGFSKQ
jgi:hypothetical protein